MLATDLRNVTASRPSIMRWSYVSARYIMGRATTAPSLTTARIFVACIPRIADLRGDKMLPSRCSASVKRACS